MEELDQSANQETASGGDKTKRMKDWILLCFSYTPLYVPELTVFTKFRNGGPVRAYP